MSDSQGLLVDRDGNFREHLASLLNHQDGFFSIILVGSQLADVMTHASQIFESPAWTSWTWDRSDELTVWFGFDMRIDGAFEERTELLPGLSLIFW